MGLRNEVEKDSQKNLAKHALGLPWGCRECSVGVQSSAAENANFMSSLSESETKRK